MFPLTPKPKSKNNHAGLSGVSKIIKAFVKEDTPKISGITRILDVGLEVDNNVVLYSTRSRYINLVSDAKFEFISSLKDLIGNYILEVKLLNIQRGNLVMLRYVTFSEFSKILYPLVNIIKSLNIGLSDNL